MWVPKPDTRVPTEIKVRLFLTSKKFNVYVYISPRPKTRKARWKVNKETSSVPFRNEWVSIKRDKNRPEIFVKNRALTLEDQRDIRRFAERRPAATGRRGGGKGATSRKILRRRKNASRREGRWGTKNKNEKNTRILKNVKSRMEVRAPLRGNATFQFNSGENNYGNASSASPKQEHLNPNEKPM